MSELDSRHQAPLASDSSLLGLLQRLSAEHDAELFRRVLLQVDELIPGDSVVLGELSADRRMLVLTGSDPALERMQSGARLLELRTEHPVLTRWEQTKDVTPTAISQLVDRKAFETTQLSRELFAELGIADQLVIPIPGGGSMMAVAVNRSRWGFTPSERRLAARMQAPLSCITARQRQAEIARCAQRRLSELASGHGSQVLLCDRCGHLLRPDGSTATGLDALTQATVVQAACAAFSPDEADPPESIRAEITLSENGGEQKRVRVFARIPGEPFVVAVVTSARARVERTVLERHGLTERQVETMLRILNGATIASVANELAISERTVEKHVLAAYQRLAVRTRTEALLAVLNSAG